VIGSHNNNQRLVRQPTSLGRMDSRIRPCVRSPGTPAVGSLRSASLRMWR